jgi:hypothetical protein
MRRAIVPVFLVAISAATLEIAIGPPAGAAEASARVAPPPLPEGPADKPPREVPSTDRKQPADAPAGEAGDAYLLRYKFQPNQFAHYEVVDKKTITTQKEQHSETLVIESKVRKHYRVTAVDERQNGTLESTIDHVVMSAQFGSAKPIVYDSDSDAAPPKEFLEVKESIGKSHRHFKFTANGELLGANSVRPRRSDSMPDDSPADQETDPTLNFLVVFPEKAVRIGESWKDRFTVKVHAGGKLQLPVDLGRRYTLKQVEGGIATIHLQQSVLSNINDPSVLGQLIQRTPSGTIVFDMNKGVIVSWDLKLDKIEIGIAGPNSSIRAVSDYSERLLTPAEVAERARTRTSRD